MGVGLALGSDTDEARQKALAVANAISVKL